ncbi:LamG domain-containing protein [Verrucomicrobia bacterium]|nr:LamG domain-containing protein [Verrucomicrobiota bacterium]
MSGFATPAASSSFDPSTMSAEFDGSNDELLLGTSAIALDTNFTMSAWIKSDYHGGYRVIMGWGGDSFSYPADAFKVRQLQIFGGISFELWGSRITGSTTILTNTWYHVAATLSGNDVLLYLNGSQDGSGTLSRASFSTSTTYIAGMPPAYSGSFANFDGLLDEVAVFDSVLSASQITSIYNSGVPGDLSSLNPVGWWRMGDGTGDTDSGGGAPANTDVIGTVVDQGSGGNNATGTNGPTYSTTVPS